MKIRPVGAELFHADGQTDMKLIINFRNFGSAPEIPRSAHTVYLCVLWVSQNKQPLFPPYNINWLVFITEMVCVYCAVRTGSLYILEMQVAKGFLWFSSVLQQICSPYHIELPTLPKFRHDAALKTRNSAQNAQRLSPASYTESPPPTSTLHHLHFFHTLLLSRRRDLGTFES
jgi:hypothetical protein